MNDAKLIICLRDKSKTPTEFIIDLKETVDYEADEKNYKSLNDLFTLFAYEVNARFSGGISGKKDCDIYIGFWGNQETFVIPPEFCKVVALLGVPIVFDIND